MKIEFELERLIAFALDRALLEKSDVIPARNSLLDLLKLSEPYSDDLPIENAVTASSKETAGVPEILDIILDYCCQKGIIEDSMTQRDLLDARIMGLLMPRASEVVKEFYRLYNEAPQKATDYFYSLNKDSNYIQTARIAKNLLWTSETEYGEMEITINLSKPEKDPKEIAAAKNAPSSNYPKCLLCVENAGFSGHLNHPARQNLRLLPVTLDSQMWFLQYSPYVYYNEHCIVLNKEHTPMKMDKSTFVKLFDFVGFLPHYFLGSNADLPIVGGSILTHDHYQGGSHVFPMEKAIDYAGYSHKDFQDVKITLVKWPMSVIRMSSDDKSNLIDIGDFLLAKWREYSDESADILAFSDDTPHNAVTPIARINDSGKYELDVVLRNNRTSGEHPMGIFHPHEKLHNIKKENIGLIEVMGLAVLPGRLSQELLEISKILSGEKSLQEAKADETLKKHKNWIDNLCKKCGLGLSQKQAEKAVRNEVGEVFVKVLSDAGVFKDTKAGREQFDKFMKYCGFKKI